MELLYGKIGARNEGTSCNKVHGFWGTAVVPREFAALLAGDLVKWGENRLSPPCLLVLQTSTYSMLYCTAPSRGSAGSHLSAGIVDWQGAAQMRGHGCISLTLTIAGTSYAISHHGPVI